MVAWHPFRVNSMKFNKATREILKTRAILFLLSQSLRFRHFTNKLLHEPLTTKNENEAWARFKG